MANEKELLEVMLFKGSQVTLNEAVLLIQCFSLRYSLSSSAVNDMLKLFSMLLPIDCKLPKTHYLFKKCIGNSSCSVAYSYCCKFCLALIGQVQLACACGAHVDEKDEQVKGNFFLSLDLANQIKSSLELVEVGSAFVPFNCRHQESSMISDITGSRIYKAEPRLSVDNNISLTWNADGVPAFKSSVKSVWPIRCFINELPYEVSRQNILIAALWFGKGKPDMKAFMTLFQRDIETINGRGVSWKHSLTGQLICSRVFPICCSSDAVARCTLQGIHQFNGSFGCSWCIDKGEVTRKGRGYARVYSSRRSRLRTHEHMVLWGRQLTSSGAEHVRGVKSVSPLLLLHNWGFNIVDGFSVEYMHCVLLGVVRQFINIWVSSSTNAEQYHLNSDNIAKADANLLAIKPCRDISRLPSSLTVAHRWKANECRAWLLHYSVMVLQELLSEQYVHHRALLVKAVYMLLQREVTADDVTESRALLTKFVSDICILYGKQHLSYNVHQLKHLSDSVLTSGPLWRTSAFPFESHNQQLLKLFHGYNHIPMQIAHCFVTLHTLPQLLKSPEISFDTRRQCQTWLDGYPLVKRALKLEPDVTLIGQSVERKLSYAELRALAPKCVTSLPGACKFYDRAVVYGKPYTSLQYRLSRENAKRVNYIVLLKTGSIAIIHKFIHDISNNILHVYCEILNPNPLHNNSQLLNHYRTVSRSYRYAAIVPEQLVSKCVLLRLRPEYMLVSLQPNVVECD